MPKPGIRTLAGVVLVFLSAQILGLSDTWAQEPAGPVAAQTASPDLQEINDLLAQRRYPEAKAQASRLLRIENEKPEPNWARVATLLDLSVDARVNAGEFTDPEVLSLAQQAVEIREREFPGSIALANSLAQLGSVFFFDGRFEQSLQLTRRANAITEERLGPDDPVVATGLIHLGDASLALGDHSQALLQTQRALVIYERALGPDAYFVATALDRLGLVHAAMGNYLDAKPVVERALDIVEKVRGPEHPDVIPALNAVARVLVQIGDVDTAKTLLLRALALQESLTAPFSLYAQMASIVTSHLAELLLPGTDDGVEFARRSLAVTETLFGTEHPNVGDSLFKLANALMINATTGAGSVDSGSIEEASALYERVLRIFTSSYPQGHPSFTRMLWTGTRVQVAMGGLVEAKETYENALLLAEAGFGPEYRGGIQADLATVQYALGDNEGAVRAALDSTTSTRDSLRLLASALPERQALAFLSNRDPRVLDLALKVAANSPGDDVGMAVWDGLVRSRAVVLDEISARHRLTSRSTDPEVAQLRRALTTARERLAHLVVRGPGQQPIDPYRQLLDGARQEKERAEAALAEKSVAFRDDQARQQVGLADVMAALPQGTGLVSFVQYSTRLGESGGGLLGPDSEATSYLAFVLRAGQQGIAIVPLGTAEAIDTLVSRWRNAASLRPEGSASLTRPDDSDEAFYREAGEALRRKIWDPLTPHIAGFARVFIVPDGALSLVNLAALPIGEDAYLIEQEPLIHYLSTERQVVALNAGPTGPGTGLLALGSVAFEGSSVATALGSPSPANSASTAPVQSPSGGGLFYGTRSGCREFQSMQFEALPATAAEVDDIIALWTDGGGGAVTKLTGAQASERAFKENAAGQRVLHLATHAFFLGGRCASVLDARANSSDVMTLDSRVQRPFVGENPMLLSGLVLAGASNRAAAGQDEEDGILTAEEIASLDLTSVEWAVLSACDTGVGTIRASEGVFGLRRAFHIAGVKTVIMSLWPVEDEAARQWMETLYDGRFSKRLGTAEAVRQASLQMLNQRRRQGDTTHPFFWAPFVAFGDWR